MAKYTYVVLTRAVAGQESAFHDWYDDRHLADTLRLPAIRSAKRYKLLSGIDSESNAAAPPFDSLALYEIDCDGDPIEVARALSALAGTEAMPLTEAFDRTATLKAFGILSASRESK